MPEPRSSVRLDGKGWTYGAEHELSDWDCSVPLPDGYGRAPDYTIVNSNGIAAQLDTSLYGFGGEINTPPTDTPGGQAECLERLLTLYPNCSVNHRSNLHVHVRVPGLRDNLDLLKRVGRCIWTQLRPLIDKLEPIPRGRTDAERKRERRRKKSHHTFLSPTRHYKQQTATTVEEFFAAECAKSPDGRILWHLAARCCVNPRQLMDTDTIEFRHFPGTTDVGRLLKCVEWCRDFLIVALTDGSVSDLLTAYLHNGYPFPRFPDFDFELEVGYQATAPHNGLSREQIAENIGLILSDRFDGSPARAAAALRARGLSR